MADEMRVANLLRTLDADLDFRPNVEAFAARLRAEEVPLITQPSITRRAARRGWRIAAAGVAFAALLAGTAFAQSARPGDLLYGVKKGSEKVWTSAALGSVARADHHLDLAGRRAEEAVDADRDGNESLASKLAVEGLAEVNEAFRLLNGISSSEGLRTRERAEEIRTRLNRLALLVEDDGRSDNSGPGSSGSGGNSGSGSLEEQDNSGPGSGDTTSDNSGTGSTSSGSGTSGSGTSGSGSSGSGGAGTSGSGSSGSGSSGSASPSPSGDGDSDSSGSGSSGSSGSGSSGSGGSD